MERNTRPVDGDLLEVGPAVSVQLRVQVREKTSLQQGIIGEIDATDDVSRLELTDTVSDFASRV